MNVSKIQLLSPEVVHRIAAGEVVEHPAAAMKELVENSIDAGATKISIIIVDGGLKLIEIKDNGLGMSRADLEACCQRHATSKIRDVADLERIFSLGFRGEALAALSSVAHLEILSRPRGTVEAWLLKRQGSKFETQPVSHAEGTTVRVRDLFFNTPARKKFLKSSASEANRCLKIFKELAVAHPEVELSLHLLSAEGELEEDLQFAKQTRKERLAALFAKEPEFFFAVADDDSAPGLKRIECLFLRPPHVARNSRDLFFIVNGRPLEDKRIAFVLREAFAGLVEVGAFPRGAVYIEVDAAEVDVNVHPQKREVRWSKDFPLYSLVYEQCRLGLQGVQKKAVPEAPDAQQALENFYSFAPTSGEFAEGLAVPEFVSSSAGSLSPQVRSEANLPKINFSELRVVGEAGAAWIVCESPQGIVVIDQHAAHERVRFAEIMHGPELFPAVPLLIPLMLELPLSLKDQEENLLELLESWGFEGKVSDQRKVEFYAVPKTARKLDWKETFAEIFDRMDQQLSTEALRLTLKTWIASSLACHGSVRRGQRLTNPEISELLRKMDAVDWKEFCPHGRPTWIQLSHERLEEEFHRS